MSSVWRRGQPCGPLRDRSGAGGGGQRRPASRERRVTGAVRSASARLSTPSRITPHVCVWWDLWMPSLHAAQRNHSTKPTRATTTDRHATPPAALPTTTPRRLLRACSGYGRRRRHDRPTSPAGGCPGWPPQLCPACTAGCKVLINQAIKDKEEGD